VGPLPFSLFWLVGNGHNLRFKMQKSKIKMIIQNLKIQNQHSSAKLKAQKAKLRLKAKSETFFFLALSFTL